jgi:osmotically-inducible protein OsmY
MQYRRGIAVCATTIAIFVSPLAYAQTAPSGADGTATSEMAPPTKKQMRMDNRLLSRAVRHSLTKTKALNASGITVLAHGGKVTLDGTVPDASQIQLAENAASATHGVTQVDNRLIVREIGH